MSESVLPQLPADAFDVDPDFTREELGHLTLHRFESEKTAEIIAIAAERQADMRALHLPGVLAHDVNGV